MSLVKERGLLITLEGLDRAGKTTQAKLLEEYLNSNNKPTKIIRFPERSTSVGQTINSYLQGNFKTDDEVIHMLFSANRWEFKNQILEDLQKGVNLILDRYAYSGVAFSSAKGLDIEWCKNCDKGLPKPDVVFFLDIHENEVKSRGDYGKELYEKEEFQKLVKEKYFLLKENNWNIVDANDSIENLHKKLSELIQSSLKVDRFDKIKKLWLE